MYFTFLFKESKINFLRGRGKITNANMKDYSLPFQAAGFLLCVVSKERQTCFSDNFKRRVNVLEMKMIPAASTDLSS